MIKGCRSKFVLSFLLLSVLFIASCAGNEPDTGGSGLTKWNGGLEAPEALADGSGDPQGNDIIIDNPQQLAYVAHLVNGTLQRADSTVGGNAGEGTYLAVADESKNQVLRLQDANPLKGVWVKLNGSFDMAGNPFPMIGRLLVSDNAANYASTIISSEDTPQDGARGYDGYSGTPFMGNFDGQGNTLQNLQILYNTVMGVGMFGFVADGAIVKNLIILDASVDGNGMVGGLIGRAVGVSMSGLATGTTTNTPGTFLAMGANPDNTTAKISLSTKATDDSAILVYKILVESSEVNVRNGSSANQAVQAGASTGQGVDGAAGIGNAVPTGGVGGFWLHVDAAFLQNNVTTVTGEDITGNFLAGVVACLHGGQLAHSFNFGSVEAGNGATVSGVTSHTLFESATQRANGQYTKLFEGSAGPVLLSPVVVGIFNQGTVTSTGAERVGGVLGWHLLGDIEDSFSFGAVTVGKRTGNFGQVVGQRQQLQSEPVTIGDNFQYSGAEGEGVVTAAYGTGVEESTPEATPIDPNTEEGLAVLLEGLNRNGAGETGAEAHLAGEVDGSSVLPEIWIRDGGVVGLDPAYRPAGNFEFSAGMQ